MKQIVSPITFALLTFAPDLVYVVKESIKEITNEDCHISYLPLAHMMERSCHVSCCITGQMKVTLVRSP